MPFNCWDYSNAECVLHDREQIHRLALRLPTELISIYPKTCTSCYVYYIYTHVYTCGVCVCACVCEAKSSHPHVDINENNIVAVLRMQRSDQNKSNARILRIYISLLNRTN